MKLYHTLVGILASLAAILPSHVAGRSLPTYAVIVFVPWGVNDTYQSVVSQPFINESIQSGAITVFPNWTSTIPYPLTSYPSLYGLYTGIQLPFRFYATNPLNLTNTTISQTVPGFNYINVTTPNGTPVNFTSNVVPAFTSNGTNQFESDFISNNTLPTSIIDGTGYLTPSLAGLALQGLMTVPGPLSEYAFIINFVPTYTPKVPILLPTIVFGFDVVNIDAYFNQASLGATELFDVLSAVNISALTGGLMTNTSYAGGFINATVIIPTPK